MDLKAPAVGRVGVDYRLDPCLPSLLCREHEGRHEWHHRTPGAWIGRPHRPRPQPRDDRCFTPIRKRRLRVEMPDAVLGLVAHPIPVIPHVFGETLRPAIALM